MGYEVRTPVFEGPFDLLLHLILRQEVDLWEVSLSTIVDAYLAEIDRMESLDLEVATEFLLIAATLVELKARRLLPATSALDLDEELLRFEERDLLLARLLECKTFKDASQAVAARMRQAARSVPRTAGPEEPYRSLVPDPLERIRPAQLRAAARRALTPRADPVVNTDHVAPIRASVRDALETVLEALTDRSAVSFKMLVAGVRDRIEIIVRFLAVLELFKQGIVELEQSGTFAELLVVRIADEDRRVDLASVGEWGDDEEPEPARADEAALDPVGDPS